MKNLQNYIEEGLLKGQSETIKAGDEYMAHQKAMKMEFDMLKKLNITDFKEHVKYTDDEIVYEYIWECHAIIKEYFGEFVEKNDINTLNIYILCERRDPLRGYYEITLCPIDSKDIGVMDEETICYQSINQQDRKIFKSDSGVDELLKAAVKEVKNIKFKANIEKVLLKLQSWME
jgi:hypothetical protein